MTVVVGDVQWDAMLKELYPEGLPSQMMMRNHSFMSLVPKDDNATGEYMVIPVVYDLPPGRSALAPTAFNSTTGPAGASKHTKFTPSLVEDYAATYLNMLTVYKTANDRGSFVEMRKREIDGILKNLGNSLAHALFRDGQGAVAQISSGQGTPTITLTNRSDAKFFVVGGQYQTADGSAAPVVGALRNGGTFVTATAIDEDAGTVTADANWTSITGTVALDFVLNVGDRNEKVTGLAGWLPLASPSATLFFGVNRTVHPTRLAGSRLDQPTVPAEDTIIDLAEIMAERGARPDRVFVSPRQFSKIAKRLGAKVEYNGGGGTAGVSFSGVRLFTSAQPDGLILTPDSDCPDNRGYILTMDSWHLKHLLDLPHIVMDDGIRALRVGGQDQIEIRARYYAQLVCYAPGQNGVFSCSL